MDSYRDHHHTCSWVGEYLDSADDACACNDLRALERQVACFDYRLARADADGFHRGVRAAIAALYYQAGHLDAVADDLRRRDKCGYAATCERKSSRLVMAAMSLEHVRSVAYQEGAE